MKKNLFVISESERERILGMHKTATKRNYLSEATAPAKPADVKGFQDWLDRKKVPWTSTGGQLNKGRGYGVFGPQTTKAWAQYGQEYTDAYGGVSPGQVYQNTATDRQGWLDYPCFGEQGTEVVTKSGYVIYKLAPGSAVVWDKDNKKPALFSGLPAAAKFERFVDCNDRSLVNVKTDRTASDELNWSAWTCVTSVGTKRVTADGWIVFDLPNNQYAYFDDVTKKPALADVASKSKLRDLECTDQVLVSAASAATASTSATTATTTTDLVGLSKLPADMQDRVKKWSETPDGKYILGLPANQREGGLDLLEKKKGVNPETRALKKEIRTALGMKADTLLGRLGQGVSGAVAGAKAGFQGGSQTTG